MKNQDSHELFTEKTYFGMNSDGQCQIIVHRTRYADGMETLTRFYFTAKNNGIRSFSHYIPRKIMVTRNTAGIYTDIFKDGKTVSQQQPNGVTITLSDTRNTLTGRNH